LGVHFSFVSFHEPHDDGFFRSATDDELVAMVAAGAQAEHDERTHLLAAITLLRQEIAQLRAVLEAKG